MIYSNILLHAKNLPVDIVLHLYEEQIKQEFDIDFIEGDIYLQYCRKMHLEALDVVKMYFDQNSEEIAIKKLIKHPNEEVKSIAKSIKIGSYERLAL